VTTCDLRIWRAEENFNKPQAEDAAAALATTHALTQRRRRFSLMMRASWKNGIETQPRGLLRSIFPTGVELNFRVVTGVSYVACFVFHL
jgi:hypothetical protein